MARKAKKPKKVNTLPMCPCGTPLEVVTFACGCLQEIHVDEPCEPRTSSEKCEDCQETERLDKEEARLGLPPMLGKVNDGLRNIRLFATTEALRFTEETPVANPVMLETAMRLLSTREYKQASYWSTLGFETTPFFLDLWRILLKKKDIWSEVLPLDQNHDRLNDMIYDAAELHVKTPADCIPLLSHKDTEFRMLGLELAKKLKEAKKEAA